MPVYVYGDNTWGSGDASQATSFIYSKDQGKTWSRTANFTSTAWGGSSWSSEAQLVDLGNGVVRCFYRNGKKKIRYCDATWNGSGYQWGDVVQDPDYSQALSYPVYRITFTTGANEDQRDWTVFALNTDSHTYFYAFRATPQAAEDLSDLYADIFSQLTLADPAQ